MFWAGKLLDYWWYLFLTWRVLISELFLGFSSEVETSAHFTNYPSNRFNMEKNVILQLVCYTKNCFTMNVISFCQIFSTRKTNEATIQLISLDAQEKCDISSYFVVVNWWSSNFPLHGCTIKSHCKVQKQLHNSPNFTICT